ncbi:MAG TPA: hypothetical protein PLP67_06810 [Methylotenera sp.]|nr:hypothetical protein [Methylotenera sp.]HPM49564.1 hypothetical protein [Methylotenera sp.]
MPSAVIPAYPYEGAFFWFISDEGVRQYNSDYYQTLFGPKRAEISVQAAALSCLFPEIILAPADTQLPDSRSCTVDRLYRHPDLRISMNWNENEWSDLNKEIARVAGQDPAVQKAVAALPHIGNNQDMQHHFLCRLVLQNRLASATEATLVGNAAFQQISMLTAPWIGSVTGGAEVGVGQPTKLPISEQALNVVGLNFAPATLDSFGAIRTSDAITDYATSFREALASAASAPDMEQNLLQLMEEAMDTEDVAKQVAGGLSTAGSALGVLGFIPFVGSAASVMGLGTDAGARTAGKVAEKKSWYLIGAKMQEVAIRDLLKRRKNG